MEKRQLASFSALMIDPFFIASSAITKEYAGVLIFVRTCFNCMPFKIVTTEDLVVRTQ